jgi:hypothetical protein
MSRWMVVLWIWLSVLQDGDSRAMLQYMEQLRTLVYVGFA